MGNAAACTKIDEVVKYKEEHPNAQDIVLLGEGCNGTVFTSTKCPKYVIKESYYTEFRGKVNSGKCDKLSQEFTIITNIYNAWNNRGTLVSVVQVFGYKDVPAKKTCYMLMSRIIFDEDIIHTFGPDFGNFSITCEEHTAYLGIINLINIFGTWQMIRIGRELGQLLAIIQLKCGYDAGDFQMMVGYVNNDKQLRLILHDCGEYSKIELTNDMSKLQCLPWHADKCVTAFSRPFLPFCEHSIEEFDTDSEHNQHILKTYKSMQEQFLAGYREIAKEVSKVEIAEKIIEKAMKYMHERHKQHLDELKYIREHPNNSQLSDTSSSS